MRRAVIASVVVAGCAYSAHDLVPGSNTARLPSCLDVTVTRTTDREAVGPVLSFRLGNRCDDRVWVDFTRMIIEGRAADGARIAVAAQDPRHEIRPGYVVARWSFDENIEYRAAAEADDARLAQLCIEPSGLERGAAPHWICLPTGNP